MATTQKRRYTRITREEFESFLDEFASWSLVEGATATELVYRIPLPVDDLEIRVYSTIQDGQARDKGSDAIRAVIYSTEDDAVVGGRRKTLRIQTWRDNLRPKLMDLALTWRDLTHGHCDRCGSRMAKRDGKHGEFLGCTAYPRCKTTRSL